MSRLLTRALGVVLVLGLVAPTAFARQMPVRVGGAVQEPKKLVNVEPTYPALALAAKVGGVVIIEATIDAEGNVRDTRVLRSNALFDQAAVEAVRQWKYTPTLLNGQPVEVLMTTVVNFALDRGGSPVPARGAEPTTAASLTATLDAAKSYIQAGLLNEATQALQRANDQLKEFAANRPPSAPPSGPFRVGGEVPEPRKLSAPDPIYPPKAKDAKVSGTVIIEALIGVDGKVKDARVLRSAALFDDAALDAVKRWVYTPTLLNGVPVEVMMTVVVNFVLK